mmetsp:Transcript_63717/g.138055  ORF Transcript_63717/g.138055 Transcript_63717/m.138055 type:complete len:247 (+) Transcript_63717:747-1487(+)
MSRRPLASFDELRPGSSSAPGPIVPPISVCRPPVPSSTVPPASGSGRSNAARTAEDAPCARVGDGPLTVEDGVRAKEMSASGCTRVCCWILLAPVRLSAKESTVETPQFGCGDAARLGGSCGGCLTVALPSASGIVPRPRASPSAACWGGSSSSSRSREATVAAVAPCERTRRSRGGETTRCGIVALRLGSTTSILSTSGVAVATSDSPAGPLTRPLRASYFPEVTRMMSSPRLRPSKGRLKEQSS